MAAEEIRETGPCVPHVEGASPLCCGGEVVWTDGWIDDDGTEHSPGLVCLGCYPQVERLTR